MIDQLFSPLAWGSPVGLGVLFICMSISAYLLSLAVKNLSAVGKK